MKSSARSSLVLVSALSFAFACLPSLSKASGTIGGVGSQEVFQTTGANVPLCATPQPALSRADVNRIVQQAATRAARLGAPATIVVADREGNVLAIFRMTGATARVSIPDGPLAASNPFPAEFAAISKAGTCAFFGTTGNAFTPRTASFIIQEHIPPGISFTPGGPLFGVQFSSLATVPGEVNPKLPFGLAGDPGAVPLFINGNAVGGIGVEVDGRYLVDRNPRDDDQAVEEVIAVAGSLGYEAPMNIRANEILVNGIRLPFINAPEPRSETLDSLASLGTFIPCTEPLRALKPTADVLDGRPYLGRGSGFICGTLGSRAVRIAVDANGRERFPIRGNSDLTAAEVERMLTQAIDQAYRSRAAIRQPLGSFVEVNATVVGADGEILGIRGTPDAPIFGFDVSCQKARTAAFFSRADAGAVLRRAGLGSYVDAAAREGVNLDGSVAFSARGFGFLHRPFFPDGIDETANGPFSTPITTFSPFNDGIQVDLVALLLRDLLTGQPPRIPNLRNGMQIFAGGVPIYKGNRLVGAVGISGDGIDQDDLVASKGSVGFESPQAIRTDRLRVRRVRLPFVKFPRHPEL